MSYKDIRLITTRELNEISNAYSLYAARISNLRISLMNIGFNISDVSDGWLLTKRVNDCSTKDKTMKCRIMVRSLEVDEIFDNVVYLTINEDSDDVHEVVSVPIVSVRDYYKGEI